MNIIILIDHLHISETLPSEGCTCIESNTEQYPDCHNTSAACGKYDGEEYSWCFVSNDDSCLDKRKSTCGGLWVECRPNGKRKYLITFRLVLFLISIQTYINFD